MENSKIKRTKFERISFFVRISLSAIFGMLIMQYFINVTFKEVLNKDLSNLIVGSLIGSFGMLIGYIIGSQMSKEKDEEKKEIEK